MEWLLPSMYWSMFRTWPVPPPVPPAARVPTDTDRELVRIVYETIAAGTGCARCPAALGRDLSLEVMPGGHTPAWQIVVATRCRGLRRHRHTAVVTKGAGDLELGRLHS
ncbi:hypothetical protein AB0F81_14415 [Actinoplanes sp. NPDC024001]|uniref:hypothetical protein n=1 Tax=Actinoplanes sp. NPDC024001 TaxID=3154598 RepID=UPI0033F8E1A1